MKLKATFILLFFTAIIYSQSQQKEEEREEGEDSEYELTHKSQPWFSEMKDGADYFDVKKNFDFYFGNRRTEKSKPRSIGESWLKSKIFYLDKNGKVQPDPVIKKEYSLNYPLNKLKTSTTTTIGSWELLGPVNSAETGYSITGNHGGYAYMNRIDPTNTSKLFVSFATGGLWVSTDKGKNWTLADSNLPDAAYSDLDVAISNPKIVYAISGNQVIKSTDGGLNWLPTALNSTSFPGSGYDIAVSTTDPNIVVAKWGDKLYRTVNGGSIWTAVLSGQPLVKVVDSSQHSEMLDWSTTNPNVVYNLSTNYDNRVQVYRSSNAGLNFSLIATLTLAYPAKSQTVEWAKLFLPVKNPNSIYVAVGGGGAGHLYKINATTGAIENTKLNMISGIGDPYNGDPVIGNGDIDMDRNDENKIAFGSYGSTRVFYSNNNGSTFTRSSSNIHYDIRTISYVNGNILAGTDGESSLSTDSGVTFNSVTNSVSNHELWGFGAAFKENMVVAGNNHGPLMVKETANGFDWYNGTGADQGNADINPLDTRYIYSQDVYSNARFFRTGPHKINRQDYLMDPGGIYSYFNSFEFSPNNYYSLITHHAGQYPRSNPNLSAWEKSLVKTEDNGTTISIVHTFTNTIFRDKISMKNPKHMYVVDGLTNNKLWHTADGGLTWTNITPNSTVTSGQTNISDIAVGDENPNEIWVTYSGVQTACKVLKSSDFGASWTNLTQPILTSFPLTKIIFQRGSDGGVYVGSKAGVFYKNNKMKGWELLGNGLPMSEIRFMFINYTEHRLKIGTSRGAFAHELYEFSPPNALISASTSIVTCPSVSEVQFKDYSVVRNASATWKWSFPGGIPSTSTEENPLVSYASAPNGSYDVSLTVTDAYGTSSQTLSKFIKVSQCGAPVPPVPETIPGNVASIAGIGDYLQVDKLNLNRNSFSFSCWIKPNGIQEDYSGIFSVQDNNTSFILNFLDGDNSIGFHPTFDWNSGLKAPAGEWSHVALVSDGTQVKVYVNGVESTNNTSLTFQQISKLNLGSYGRGYTDSRFTNLEMDEVCIWNRALSKDEIRQWRHLTKSDLSSPIRRGLVLYYQFNETDGNLSLNKATGSNDATYFGQSVLNHNPSSAPVFGGVSQKIAITTAGAKDFNTTGLSMKFANGTTPNGDVWVSRSTINPDVLPDASSNFGSYTIVNNYGTNQTFTPLESMTFTGNAKYTTRTADKYKLYKRGSNDFGKTWGNAIDTGDSLAGTAGIGTAITFSTGLSVSSFSQFVLSSGDSTLSVDDFRINNEPILYPNPIEANENLNIKIPSDWEIATLIIYNIQGQRIGQATLNPGENNLRINASTGIYNLVIFNSTNRINKKLIVK